MELGDGSLPTTSASPIAASHLLCCGEHLHAGYTERHRQRGSEFATKAQSVIVPLIRMSGELLGIEQLQTPAPRGSGVD